jgi:pectinesterase
MVTVTQKEAKIFQPKQKIGRWVEVSSRLIVFSLALSITLYSISILAFDAVVDPHYKGAQGELVNGFKRYTTIRAAVAAAPQSSAKSFVIYVKAGLYKEQVRVTKANITIQGQTADSIGRRVSAILEFDAANNKIGPSGRPYGIHASPTLIIAAPDFKMHNMTVRNTFDFLANLEKSPADSSKVKSGTQAMAVYVSGTSDRTIFENVRIEGYEDTLWLSAGRVYLSNCYISGIADFIYGSATAVFFHSDIVSRFRPGTKPGWITAPSTPKSQTYGFVFLSSRFLREPKVSNDMAFLGRPWRTKVDPLVRSSTVILNSYMDSHILAQGWDGWAQKNAQGKLIPVSATDARFYEYQSYGPGADHGGSRRELTAKQALMYTRKKIFGDWTLR